MLNTNQTAQAGARTHIDWNKISRLEMKLIDECAKRASGLYAEVGCNDNALTITMDLAGAHIDCPIDLAALRDCDQSTFGHDMLGIRRHFNRRTFRLEDCFVPRAALRQEAA